MSAPESLALADGNWGPASPLEALGVFKPNRRAPVHRWVTFTEGFSAQLVARYLERAAGQLTVYDPFGGTGTTPLAAAQLGHRGVWSEVNPYLREAADTKIRAARAERAQRRRTVAALGEALLLGPAWDAWDDTHGLLAINAKRRFFDMPPLEELLAWCARFAAVEDDLARRLGRLAVATAAVPCSNMKRAADLRRRTPGELAKARPRASEAVREKVAMICDDLRATPRALGSARFASEDARCPPEGLGDVDLVVTSPPYLNGTNYFRNTKLELLLLGLLETEADLGAYRTRAITAGINNVSKRLVEPRRLAHVEPVAQELDRVAYDARIPRMVRAYFADMATVLSALRRVVRPAGRLVIDIGDSRFAGVHVDTPSLLNEVAEEAGWVVLDVETIRSRVARDGGALCQKLLSFHPA